MSGFKYDLVTPGMRTAGSKMKKKEVCIFMIINLMARKITENPKMLTEQCSALEIHLRLPEPNPKPRP